MREDIARCVAETDGVSSLDELSGLFLGKIAAIGFHQVAYVLAARRFRRVPAGMTWRLRRLTPEWNRLYDLRDYRGDDPLIEEAVRAGAPFRMSEIVARGNLSPRQHDFFDDMKAAGIDDFAVVPVSSRPGEVACFYFPVTDGHRWQGERLPELEAICVVCHSRYGALVAAPGEAPLSPRETEIVELISKGMTNPAIGDALGISVNTVDTLVRRSFEKLGVTTRVEAVLAAISRGLILP